MKRPLQWSGSMIRHVSKESPGIMESSRGKGHEKRQQCRWWAALALWNASPTKNPNGDCCGDAYHEHLALLCHAHVWMRCWMWLGCWKKAVG